MPAATVANSGHQKSRPHTVPLTEPALRLLGEMQRVSRSGSDIVFPGANGGTVLNAATLRHMLKAMGYGGEMTTHGMREACFRTGPRNAPRSRRT